MGNYIPVNNFFNLNNFNLTKSEFQKCYNLQKFLRSVQDKSKYYKSHCKNDWEKAKEMSAELQEFLLPRLKKGRELA